MHREKGDKGNVWEEDSRKSGLHKLKYGGMKVGEITVPQDVGEEGVAEESGPG